MGIIFLSLSPMFVRWADGPGIVTSFYRMLTASVIMGTIHLLGRNPNPEGSVLPKKSLIWLLPVLAGVEMCIRDRIQAAWGYLTQITKKGVFNELDPKPSPYITRTWWHPGWIPFITNDAGDYFCLDTDPIEPQRTGQIILFLREHPERYLIATSLDDWLALISQTLFAGFFAYDPERGFNNEAFMCSALEGKHFFESRRSLIANEQNDKKDTP